MRRFSSSSSSGKGGVGKTTVTASIATAWHDVVSGCERRVIFDFIHVIEKNCRFNQALIKDKRLDRLSLLAASQTRDKDALTEGVEKGLDELKRRDNVRAKLFRAALEEGLGKEFKDVLNGRNPVEEFKDVSNERSPVKDFKDVLEKRNLVNVFRSVLEDEKQFGWLETAVSDARREEFKSVLDSRDQKMFYEELIQRQQLLVKKQRQADLSNQGRIPTSSS
ncbi:septum site-determining protein [Plasmopara halstedii]|uniref:Septum site-determining protein n=1 Tax=Plasmopara halstedii TaxID=4781 RepID=A0A0P1AK24_PLAHL|nr:septum site-determining protein [Plasmopara halstedii]CEG41250.1 septum site-determining protein [Plasmopara halstedii]|eukprot:XP_024577619.1 septum site-determining protein [Plasmopara halstedii]